MTTAGSLHCLQLSMPATDYLYALQSKVRRAVMPNELAHAMGDLAFTEMRMGYVAQAEAKLAEIAQAGISQNDPEIAALHAYLLGAFDVYTGRTTASLKQLLSAQHLARLAGANNIEARALALLCMSLSTIGAFSEAFEAGDRALELAILTEDDRAIGTACIALTNLYVDRGEAASALLQIDKATTALERLNDPFTRISANISRLPAYLLNARQHRDSIPELTQACLRAVADAENAQHLKGLAHALINLSHAHHLAENTASAIAVINRAIEMCMDANTVDKLAPACQAKAIFLMHEQQYEAAAHILKQALDAAISADYLLVHEEIASLQVSCCEKLGDIAGAFAAAKAHTQILLKQRMSERTNLATLRKAREEFSHIRVQLSAAHEQADALRVEQTRLIANTKTFEQLSFEDALTQLKNRRYFDNRYPQYLITHASSKHPLCMAIIDVDSFKNINDKFGHLIGDAVLQNVATCLREASASIGFDAEICRLGGDEFVFFIPDLALPAATAVCEKLRLNLLASPAGTLYGATVSIGVAQWNGCENHTEFLTRIDQKLFTAKHAGRNRIAS
jgi:two-component system, cell cycle response regulator